LPRWLENLFYPEELPMTPQSIKESGWTITAAALFLLSFLIPLIAAPVLLMGSLAAGLLGYFQKEFGGLPPVALTILSFIALVVFLNRLFFTQ
jgi:hypothetical protein